MTRAVTGKEQLMEHKTLQGGPGRLPAGSGTEAETRRRVAGQEEVMVKKPRRSSRHVPVPTREWRGFLARISRASRSWLRTLDVILWILRKVFGAYSDLRLADFSG